MRKMKPIIIWNEIFVIVLVYYVRKYNSWFRITKLEEEKKRLDATEYTYFLTEFLQYVLPIRHLTRYKNYRHQRLRYI